ncbi:MAG TPA: lipoyl synthase [Symbiobacteriaceae bacterium]|nr:lipoyl synthase [Symbiobacteriaceae bacterium]
MPSRSKQDVGRKPEWLKINLKTNPEFGELKQLMRSGGLHTVCEEARCPNIFECWNRRTATFMILGDVCTRNCGFCAVKSGLPTVTDWAEPERVADAAAVMKLKHLVVTSVARDDLNDGGAAIFAETIRAIRRKAPQTGVEVLISDLGGSLEALQVVMDAEPDVLNHNVETVARLSDRVRSRAKYPRSLEVLRRAKEMKPHIPTKSSIMVGLGETLDELYETMDDLRANQVDIVTFGQYLRPSTKHLAVERFYTPAEFDHLRDEGLKRGFAHVQSGPLVRSSYHADEQSEEAVNRRLAMAEAALKQNA